MVVEQFNYMNFLKKLKIRWQQRRVAQLSSQHPREQRRLHTSSAKTVGILFDATEPNNCELALKYGEKWYQKGKKVSFLGFINAAPPKKNGGDAPSFLHFYKNEVTWLWQTKSKTAEHFMQQSFDILIGLYTKHDPVMDSVAACSLAHFKIGGTDNSPLKPFDFVLDVGENAELPRFIQQLDFYLQKLQPASHVAHVAPLLRYETTLAATV